MAKRTVPVRGTTVHSVPEPWRTAAWSTRTNERPRRSMNACTIGLTVTSNMSGAFGAY